MHISDVFNKGAIFIMTATNKQPIPILGPLFSVLFLSRKGQIWFVSLIVMVLVAYLPVLEEVRQQLMDVLMIVWGLISAVIIAAIAYEDGQAKEAGRFPRLEDVDFTPLTSPIIALLRSRKFIVWLAALIVSFLVANIPQLAEMETQLMEIFVVIVGVITSVLFGAIAYEDGKAKKPSPVPVAAQVMDEDPSRTRTVRGEDLPTLLRKTGS